MAWMVGCCCRARLSSSPTCVGTRARAAADISAARRAEDHLFGSRHPGRFGLVVGEPRGGLQRLLICVQDQVPFVVFLAGAHGAEWNSNVLFAHAEKSANANDYGRDTALLVDQSVIDVADFIVRRIVNTLLIE